MLLLELHASWPAGVSFTVYELLYKGCRRILKEEFVFVHIKPYNQDIYDHMRCSAALFWQVAQSWELEAVADVTANWKQQRSMCTQTVRPKI